MHLCRLRQQEIIHYSSFTCRTLAFLSWGHENQMWLWHKWYGWKRNDLNVWVMYICMFVIIMNNIDINNVVTAIVSGGKFKFAVATIWWVMVSLSVLIGWIWRHLLESDRLPFSTVSFLLPETLSRLSCDSSLILEPATMMKEAWYSKVCIQCHPCLIIGYLVLYFGLSGSMYPDLFVVVIILRRLINLGRYFVGISWGFFHLSSGNLVTRENIFKNL